MSDPSSSGPHFSIPPAPPGPSAPPDASPSASASASSSTASFAPTQCNVRVVTRLRPLSATELETDQSATTKAVGCTKSGKPNAVQMGDGEAAKRFEFDEVFAPKSSNSNLYESVAKPMIHNKIFRGFNATILAYGQTGSGKTFTMGTNWEGAKTEEEAKKGGQNDKTGDDADADDQDRADNRGIIPCSVDEIFKLAATYKGSVEVNLSYLEIYNEEVKDLLGEGEDAGNLPIREGIDGSVHVQGLACKPVKTPQDVASLMSLASLKRATAATAMNSVSSRSHAICTLYIVATPDGKSERSDSNPEASESESSERTESSEKADTEDTHSDTEQISSKFTLVDLAGSERLKRTNAEGSRKKEGININKGLFVLGQVISGLSERGKDSTNNLGSFHVPYRDSKLTRLLTDSLGGNSHTCMIACVSPAQINAEESTNTLRYAQRARAIKNSAVRNVIAATLTAAEAASLRRENQMLKLQLLQAQMSSPAIIDNIDAGVSLHGINVEKLEVVMKLRCENTGLQTKIQELKEISKKREADSFDSAIQLDKYRYKYENLLEEAKAHGFTPSDAASNSPSLITDMRHEISALKKELEDARIDSKIARATASAIVVGDGNLTAAAQIAILDSNDEEIEEESTNPYNDKLVSELNALSGDIQHKVDMEKKLQKERETMETLKGHFEGAMERLTDEIDALNQEKNVLMAKMVNNDRKGNNQSDAVNKKTVIENKKMKERVNELQDRIKELNKKSAEHSRSLKMREAAEKRCAQLKLEIEADKKRKVSLQKKMKEEMEARRNEKKAADMKANIMLREGDRLKMELAKVKDSAAKQAAVLKRKASEAIAKQKQLAEQRKRQMAHKGKDSKNMKLVGGSLQQQRKQDLVSWLEEEVEITASAKAIQIQLEDQAHLRSMAADKRDRLVGSRNYNASKEVSVLEMELETRTGVIKQLQRSLSELDRASKVSNNKIIINSTATTNNPNNMSCWAMFTKNETKYVLAKTFDSLVETKLENNELSTKLKTRDDAVVEAALDEERAKSRKHLKKLEFKHSEAMMSLLEATKGAVEHDLTVKVMEADGAIDADCKNAVDDMLFGFLSGCEAVTNDLNKNIDLFMDEERKLKVKEEKKKQAEIMKKKRKKFEGFIEEESEPEEEEEYVSAAEDSEDSDWEPDSKTKKKSGGKKTSFGKAAAAVPLHASKNDDGDEEDDISLSSQSSGRSKSSSTAPATFISHSAELPSEEELSKMKVAELKQLLRARSLPVSGRKDDLIARLLERPSQEKRGNEEEKAQMRTKEEERIEPALPVVETTTVAAPSEAVPVVRIDLSRSTPVVAATKPVVAATKPVVAATKPIVAATKPVVAATKPVVPATKPVVAATKPVVAATKPVVAAAKPVVDATKPVVDAIKLLPQPPISKSIKKKPSLSVAEMTNKITKSHCNSTTTTTNAGAIEGRERSNSATFGKNTTTPYWMKVEMRNAKNSDVNVNKTNSSGHNSTQRGEILRDVMNTVKSLETANTKMALKANSGNNNNTNSSASDGRKKPSSSSLLGAPQRKISQPAQRSVGGGGFNF